MSFLHRLHPGRASAAGAVRADIAPRFAPAAAAEDAPSMGATHAGSVAPPRPQVDTHRASLEAPASGAPAASPRLESSHALPAAVPKFEAHAMHEPPRAVAPPQLASPSVAATPQSRIERTIERTIERASHTETIKPAITLQRTVAAEPMRNPAQSATPNVQRPGAGRALPTAAPLRAQALPPAPTQTAPTVVSVTIDRLDVRLPAEDRAAPAPHAVRRPRATTAAPSLGDYLRGKRGGGT